MTLLAVIQSFFLEDAQAALHLLYPNTEAKVITYCEDFDHSVFDVVQDDVILLLPYVNNNVSPEIVIDLPATLGKRKRDSQQVIPISMYCKDSYVVVHDGRICHNRNHTNTERGWLDIKVEREEPISFEQLMEEITRSGFVYSWDANINPMYNKPAFIAVKEFMYRGVVRFHPSSYHVDYETYGQRLDLLRMDLAKYATLIAIHKRYGRYQEI